MCEEPPQMLKRVKWSQDQSLTFGSSSNSGHFNFDTSAESLSAIVPAPSFSNESLPKSSQNSLTAIAEETGDASTTEAIQIRLQGSDNQVSGPCCREDELLSVIEEAKSYEQLLLRTKLKLTAQQTLLQERINETNQMLYDVRQIMRTKLSMLKKV